MCKPIVAWESSTSTSSSVEWYEWPEVTYADIYNFLINTTSYCTHEQLKAFKSLDGYNFFVNGWVTNVTVILSRQINKTKIFIVMSLVKHSQRLSASPLKVWVAAKQQGEVLYAHCTCMADLGEACSHISALLFALETNTQLKSQFTSTSLPCSWLPPSFRSVPFAEITQIDFSTPAQKRKILIIKEADTSTSSDKPPLTKKTVFVVSKPSEDEKDAFYKELSQCKGKPVILSLIPDYSEPYIPLCESGKLMKPLTELHSAAALKLSYPELLQKCEDIYETISFSFSQTQQVEEMSRSQADSRLWFQQRSGRITASKLRQVLHTDYSQPSLSLVSSICYPDKHKGYVCCLSVWV